MKEMNNIPLLQVHNLSFQYDSERVILDRI